MSHTIAVRWSSPVIRGCVLLLMGISALGCGGTDLMPTPNVYVDAKVDPFKDVPPALQGGKMDILYVTDRSRVPNTKGDVQYGVGRSRSVAYGSCVVEIGKDIPWATIVKESRSRDRSTALPLVTRSIKELGRFGEIPAPIVRQGGELVREPAYMARKQKRVGKFYKELRRRLALTPRKDVYIFVHGFNNTFDEATSVTAELWHFLGRQGVPIAYTWPAGAGTSLRGYTTDYESSRFAGVHLKGLLGALAKCPDVEKIHLIAHSRGTDVATTAVRELVIACRAAKEDPKKTLKIANVTLAAPDMDFKLVTLQMNADQTFEGVGAMTVYVSSTDKAIALSEWIFGGGTRVGDLNVKEIGPVQRQNMAVRTDLAVVDAKIRVKGAGHSYYHSSPAVSSDLIMLLRYGRKPGAENGRPLTKVIPGFYSLNDNYLKNPTPPK